MLGAIRQAPQHPKAPAIFQFIAVNFQGLGQDASPCMSAPFQAAGLVMAYWSIRLTAFLLVTSQALEARFSGPVGSVQLASLPVHPRAGR